jgi:mannosyltransferase OCH1-like enzyme
MIPRKIHQVFWSFTASGAEGKELNDIPKFKEYTTKTQQFANHYGYEYKLWSLKDCEELIVEYFPQYIVLWTEFRHDIQRCDFIRYLILFIHGGWYLDCDVYPLQDMKPLESLQQVFTTWHIDKNKLPYNAVMGSTYRNPLFLKIMKSVERRTYEKQNKSIYDTWKGRLVFQTTGHHMLKQHIPKEDIHDLLTVFNEKKKINNSSKNPYFHDSNISSWWNK